MSIIINGALTKERRDALPDSDFAVPETRDLPMHDLNHVKMAWKMVDETKGLSSEQRSKAKKRIVKRAHKLGVDTSDWNIKANAEEAEAETENEAISASLNFAGMALEFPNDDKHPNKVPFTGILTRVDEPSDNALSKPGKRVILPKDVAEAALSSLLGMAIDFTENLDAHDVKSKIGLITDAYIEGNAIHIGGYFYGADFEDEVKRIQAEKSSLGFSYEAQAQVRSMNDDPLVIKSCVFTGAAVLYKDRAAYTSTSLSAQMEKNTMNNDEKIIQMMDALNAKLEKLEASIAEKEAANAEKEKEQKLAAGNIQHLIKPHAEAMRQCAAGMAASGMGMHPKTGHVAVLHHMADNMEADAVLGKMPHIYRDHDFLMASREEDTKASAESSKEMTELKASLDAANSAIADLKKASFHAASNPERKTLSPSILSLLNKVGIQASADSKMTVADVDKLLANANIKTSDKIAIKLSMQGNGSMSSDKLN
jgi:hypothetical protein